MVVCSIHSVHCVSFLVRGKVAYICKRCRPLVHACLAKLVRQRCRLHGIFVQAHGIFVRMSRCSHGKKILRSLSGIGGISDRSLSRVLTWVKDNPEVLDQNVAQRSVIKPFACVRRCRPLHVCARMLQRCRPLAHACARTTQRCQPLAYVLILLYMYIYIYIYIYISIYIYI